MQRTQRTAILQAARDAAARPEQARLVDGRMTYDAVSLAVDTGNFWWQGGLDNRTCEAALRLIHMQLRRPREVKS